MVKDILSEIARLKQVKVLLSASGAFVAKRKPDQPAKVVSVEAPKVQKTRMRRKMSAEGRERIQQAQITLWAALKGASKAKMSAADVPPPKAKKKGARAA